MTEPSLFDSDALVDRAAGPGPCSPSGSGVGSVPTSRVDYVAGLLSGWSLPPDTKATSRQRKEFTRLAVRVLSDAAEVGRAAVGPLPK